MRGFSWLGATPAEDAGVAIAELVEIAGELALAIAAEFVTEAGDCVSALCAGSGQNAKPRMTSNAPAADGLRAFTGQAFNTGPL